MKDYIVYRILFFIVLALAIVCCSCQGAGSSYIDAMNDSLEIIIPSHVAYLKSDTKLTETEREVMIKSSNECLELSRTAKKEKDKK